MPFGLKMLQDMFQMRMDHITDRLPDVIAIQNDICVYGKTQEQHDGHLLQLLKTAKAKGLVFNSRKCHISRKQMTFFWHDFLRTRNEARSHLDSGFARPYNAAEPETTTVLPWVSELSTAISARHSCQDHLLERTSLPVGLHTFNR